MTILIHLLRTIRWVLVFPFRLVGSFIFIVLGIIVLNFKDEDDVNSFERALSSIWSY